MKRAIAFLALASAAALDPMQCCEAVAQAVAAAPADSSSPATPSTATPEEFCTWTDTSGKFTVEAVLVGVEGEKVHLRNRNGHILIVDSKRLSASDREVLVRETDQREEQQHPGTPDQPQEGSTSADDEGNTDLGSAGWRGSCVVATASRCVEFAVVPQDALRDPGLECNDRVAVGGGFSEGVSRRRLRRLFGVRSRSASETHRAACKRLQIGTVNN